MDVICPECGREFYIETAVWENIISDVRTHQRRVCPHCGESMCFTCQYVPADIFTAQGVMRTRGMMPRPVRGRDRSRRPSPRRRLTQKPNYPF